MKKLIIQLLCAEILSLRKIANEALSKNSEAKNEINATNTKTKFEDFQEYFREIKAENTRLLNENMRLVKENVGLWSAENPKWKNSVKDGLPNLKVGDILFYLYNSEIDEKPYVLEVKEHADMIFIPNSMVSYNYFIIPQNNATN